MPMYDYLCSECGHRFEQMEKIDNRKNPEKSPCPSCGKQGITFQIGAPAIGDSVRLGLTKPDDGFREVMAKIKQKHKINQLKDRKWGN